MYCVMFAINIRPPETCKKAVDRRLHILKIVSNSFFTLRVIEDFDNVNELITCCNSYNQCKIC